MVVFRATKERVRKNALMLRNRRHSRLLGPGSVPGVCRFVKQCRFGVVLLQPFRNVEPSRSRLAAAHDQQSQQSGPLPSEFHRLTSTNSASAASDHAPPHRPSTLLRFNKECQGQLLPGIECALPTITTGLRSICEVIDVGRQRPVDQSQHLWRNGNTRQLGRRRCDFD